MSKKRGAIWVLPFDYIDALMSLIFSRLQDAPSGSSNCSGGISLERLRDGLRHRSGLSTNMALCRRLRSSGLRLSSSKVMIPLRS